MRWILAASSALALAFATLPAPPEGVAAIEAALQAQGKPDAAACDAKAKPANLNFTLKDMHGKDVNFASFKGKVILLDFWATWCGPCKIEIPAFVELQNKYRNNGLQVLGVSVDDTVDKLRPFATQFKMNYPVLVGANREDVQDAYGPMYGIPVTFLISRDAKVCRKHTGMATKQQFEREIRALLGLSAAS